MKVDVHESANGGRDAEQPVSSFERVPTAEPIEVLVDMDAGHGKLKAAKKAAKKEKKVRCYILCTLLPVTKGWSEFPCRTLAPSYIGYQNFQNADYQGCHRLLQFSFCALKGKMDRGCCNESQCFM